MYDVMKINIKYQKRFAVRRMLIAAVRAIPLKSVGGGGTKGFLKGGRGRILNYFIPLEYTVEHTIYESVYV